MANSRSLYNIINGVERKPTKAKTKHHRWTKPVPVGHHIAINVFKQGIYQDTLFADHIDVCNSHTMIYFNKRSMESYPITRVNELMEVYGTWVFYANNTEFQIIRIS